MFDTASPRYFKGCYGLCPVVPERIFETVPPNYAIAIVTAYTANKHCINNRTTSLAIIAAGSRTEVSYNGDLALTLARTGGLVLSQLLITLAR